jgi:hypothetical protein
MPTVLRIGAARFFFYSNELNEPPHVHVEQASSVAKFWLDPVSLAASRGFRRHELRHLERVIGERRHLFLQAWREYFET